MIAYQRPILVIGGAGFIGSNLAHVLGRRGHRIRVYDDLSRPGVEQNLSWLGRELGPRLDVRIADVRDRHEIRHALADADAVFHFAAPAATSAVEDPRRDFEVNALGTLEVLEAMRELRDPPPMIYASTSKVYGCLPDVPLQIVSDRWCPVDARLAAHGIDEARGLELHTPHGCSKGCADQYVLDYAHSYGLPATVFRASCIYGPRQLGAEDQGWVAQFLISAIEGTPITIYGDGRQLHDVLHVDDLVEALRLGWAHIRWIRGRAFNIGGGPDRTLSQIDLLDHIERLRGRRAEVRFADQRAGEQRYYASNTSAFSAATGWSPRIALRAGIDALHGWLVGRPRTKVAVVKEGAARV